MTVPLLSQHVVCPVAGSGHEVEPPRTARTGPVPALLPVATRPSWKSTNHACDGLTSSDVDDQKSPSKVQLHAVTLQPAEQRSPKAGDTAGRRSWECAM